MTVYRIPVEFASQPYRGKSKVEIRNIDIEASTPLDAMKQAREVAAGRIGKRIANILCQVFTVRSVTVRMDLFKEPR
jgi:hypothetical protein